MRVTPQLGWIVAWSFLEGILNTTISDEPAGQRGKALQKLPAAVLWDMDGTLVDTEPYWIATEFALAEEYGGEWSEADAAHLVGSDLIVSGAYIKNKLGLPHTPAEVVELLLDGVCARLDADVPWRPGARELLADLVAQDIPCALVTMSWQRFAAPILAHLPPESFKVIVTGEQVANGKPHPEPYETAAAALGVDPRDCVAIEDSPTGATSAGAAGCTVLVVPNHVPVPLLPGWIERDSLTGIDATTLKSLPFRDRPEIDRV